MTGKLATKEEFKNGFEFPRNFWRIVQFKIFIIALKSFADYEFSSSGIAGLWPGIELQGILWIFVKEFHLKLPLSIGKFSSALKAGHKNIPFELIFFFF